MTLKDQLDDILTRINYIEYKIDSLREWSETNRTAINELNGWVGEIEEKLNSILEPAEEYVLDMELEPND